MNFFIVFAPYLFLLLLALLVVMLLMISQLVAGVIRIWIFHKAQTGIVQKEKLWGFYASQWDKILFIGLFGVILIFLVSIFDSSSNRWLKAHPSADWEKNIRNADVALAFGFGLVEQQNDKSLPGSANDSLFSWLVNHSDIKYLIAQKGILLAAGDTKGIHLVEMHVHDSSKYVNTYAAVDSAFKKLDSLSNNFNITNRIIVAAHDMQMKRLVWILQKKIAENKGWERFSFIIPDISGVPYPHNSSQFHTRNRFVYKVVELYYSRPRDYLHSIFH